MMAIALACAAPALHESQRGNWVCLPSFRPVSLAAWFTIVPTAQGFKPATNSFYTAILRAA